MKYFKPASLTWWAAMVPLIAGAIVAGEPVHGMSGITAVINNITGDMHPAVMINSALVAIGMRAAV